MTPKRRRAGSRRAHAAPPSWPSPRDLPHTARASATADLVGSCSMTSKRTPRRSRKPVDRSDAVRLCDLASASHAQNLLTASRNATPQVCRRRAVSLPASLGRTAAGPHRRPVPWVVRMTAASTHEVIAFLDQLSSRSASTTTDPTALQVPGGAEVATSSRGSRPVSSSSGRRRRRRPRARPPRALLARQPLEITPVAAPPSEAALRPGMALAAYHLPLDGHPEHGNNALLAEGLGCTATEPFAEHHGRPIGVPARSPATGSRSTSSSPASATLTGREPLALREGPEHRVAGSASSQAARADYLADAASAGSTPSSPASRGARLRPRPRGAACTSSPPAITRPRRSASADSATCSPEARVVHRSSTSPTRSRHVALTTPLSTSVTSATNGFACRKQTHRRQPPMANHLTPTELAREAGLERREVISKCMEMGVPIFQGRIDKTLFITSLQAEQQPEPAKLSPAAASGRRNPHRCAGSATVRGMRCSAPRVPRAPSHRSSPSSWRRRFSLQVLRPRHRCPRSRPS